MTNFDDQVAELIQLASLEPAPPRPSSYYSKHGDCLFVHGLPGPYCAEPVDERLTLYISLEDGKIVGLQLKDLSTLPDHDTMEVLVTNSSKPEGEHIAQVLLYSWKQSTGDKAADMGYERARDWAKEKLCHA